jgi:hypothetical protein
MSSCSRNVPVPPQVYRSNTRQSRLRLARLRAPWLRIYGFLVRHLPSQHLAVQSLQAVVFVDPLLQRQTAHLRHVDRSVQPVIRVAIPNVEVPIAFLDVDIVAEPPKFVVDRFEREAHGVVSLPNSIPKHFCSVFRTRSGYSVQNLQIPKYVTRPYYRNLFGNPNSNAP